MMSDIGDFESSVGVGAMASLKHLIEEDDESEEDAIDDKGEETPIAGKKK